MLADAKLSAPLSTLRSMSKLSPPSDVADLPSKLPESDPEPEHRPSVDPFGEAIRALALGLRSRDFWLLAGSFFICGASTNGLIGTHLVPACMDHGMPEVQARALLTEAFIGEVIDRIGHEGARDVVRAWAAERLWD